MTSTSAPNHVRLALRLTRGARAACRCYISDGEAYAPAFLNSTASQLFSNETIKQYSVVRLMESLVTSAKSTKVVLVMALELVEHRDEVIGEPKPVAEVLKARDGAVHHTENTGTPMKGAPSQNTNTTPESSSLHSRTQPSAFGNGEDSVAKSASNARNNIGAARPPSPPAAIGKPTPINALNPYSSKWTIKAKVTQNGELRQITSKSGVPFAVWEMVVADESGEIKVTAWREQAERFSQIAEEGRSFLLSRGQIKMANKRYSTTSNSYEITLGHDSQMIPCSDNVTAFTPTYHYDFTRIADIANKPEHATVDIIGVATAVGPLTEVTSKKGTQLVKRVLTVSDDSNAAIEVTLWGKTAQTFPEDAQSPVVAFKGVQVSDWNTKSLGMARASRLQIDPVDVPDAKRVRMWADEGNAQNATTLSVNTRGDAGGGGASAGDDLADLQEAGQDLSDGSSVYATVRCFISKIITSKGGPGGEERPLWFAACTKCGKKALGEESSGFSCEACGWSGDTASYRYIVALRIEDGSAATIATAFQEQAHKILDKSADELKAIKDQSKDAFDAAIQAAVWKRYSLRLRLKGETYQGQHKTKLSIVGASPVNFVADGKKLLSQIRMYDLPDEAAPPPRPEQAQTEVPDAEPSFDTMEDA